MPQAKSGNGTPTNATVEDSATPLVHEGNTPISGGDTATNKGAGPAITPTPEATSGGSSGMTEGKGTEPTVAPTPETTSIVGSPAGKNGAAPEQGISTVPAGGNGAAPATTPTPETAPTAKGQGNVPSANVNTVGEDNTAPAGTAGTTATKATAPVLSNAGTLPTEPTTSGSETAVAPGTQAQNVSAKPAPGSEPQSESEISAGGNGAAGEGNTVVIASPAQGGNVPQTKDAAPSGHVEMETSADSSVTSTVTQSAGEDSVTNSSAAQTETVVDGTGTFSESSVGSAMQSATDKTVTEEGSAPTTTPVSPDSSDFAANDSTVSVESPTGSAPSEEFAGPAEQTTSYGSADAEFGGSNTPSDIGVVNENAGSTDSETQFANDSSAAVQTHTPASQADNAATNDNVSDDAYIPSNGFSQRVYAGWVATFVNAGEGIDVDMFFEHMSREAVFNKISTQLRLSRANAMDSHDTDSDYQARMEKISSSEYMLRGLSSGEEFYYLSMLITIVADTKKELDYKFDALKKRIEGQSMKIRRADFMMEECFDSCLLPLAKINKELAKKSHRNLLTSGVASCYPFISFEMQDPGGVMVGTNHVNNSLVTIDMFDTRAHANANAVILGSSGYGKTFTAQLFALRLSEMDTQVFIISPLKGLEDYGGGCKAVNGQFVSMDPSSDNNINIMDIRAPDDEDAKLLDDYEASGSFLTKKIHTILSFLHLVVRNMTQEEEQLIDGCLYATYAKFGITRDNNSIYDKDGNYKVMPLLEDLQEEMRKNPELHTVCNILNPLINGSMACFNHHTNVDLDSKYIVFDFNGMKGSLLTMSMFVVLDFVWTKIKEDRTQRKAVFIDECWKLIGTDSNEQAAEDVVEIFRTIRAYGGSAFAMTQDISQFYEYKGGKYGKAIIGNADTKIIMHLIPSEAKALQEAIQLTSVEMEAVSSLPRGQGLVCSASAKLFVDFVADDYEAKEITTDAKSFYERRKALEKKKREEEEKAAENTVIDVEM